MEGVALSLEVSCEGATPEQLEAAKAAALKVFADAKMDPLEGFMGLGAAETYDESGFDKQFSPTREQMRALSVLGLAEGAANQAVPGLPSPVYLEWVPSEP